MCTRQSRGRPGPRRGPGAGRAEVLAHEVRLAVDHLDSAVGRDGSRRSTCPRAEAAIGGERRMPAAHGPGPRARRLVGRHQHGVRPDRQRDPAAGRKLHRLRSGELSQDRRVAEIDGDPAGRAEERRGDHGTGQRPDSPELSDGQRDRLRAHQRGDRPGRSQQVHQRQLASAYGHRRPAHHAGRAGCSGRRNRPRTTSPGGRTHQ